MHGELDSRLSPRCGFYVLGTGGDASISRNPLQFQPRLSYLVRDPQGVRVGTYHYLEGPHPPIALYVCSTTQGHGNVRSPIMSAREAQCRCEPGWISSLRVSVKAAALNRALVVEIIIGRSLVITDGLWTGKVHRIRPQLLPSAVSTLRFNGVLWTSC